MQGVCKMRRLSPVTLLKAYIADKINRNDTFDLLIFSFYLQKLNWGIEQICLNCVLHIIQDLPCDTQGKDITYSARYGGKIWLVFGDMAYEQWKKKLLVHINAYICTYIYIDRYIHTYINIYTFLYMVTHTFELFRRL